MSSAPVARPRPGPRRTRAGTGSDPASGGGWSEPVEPPGHHRADRGVQGDQVGGVGEPLDVGLGGPGPQVGQEPVVEDGVPAAPQQQGRPGVVVEHGGALLQGSVGGVGRGDRDVGHEVAHRLAAVRRPVRGPQGRRGAGGRVMWAVPVDEGRGAPAGEVDQAAGGGDQRGDGDVVGLGHGGVGQHQRLDVERPRGPDGHRAAPVVGGQHQGAVHLLAAERDQLGHPVGQPPGAAPLGPAHAGLVDGDHPPVGGQGGEQVAPDVAPGRVAVDADHGAGRTGPGVEHVPVDGAPVGAVDGHPTGPRRVEAPGGQLVGASGSAGRGRTLRRRGGDGSTAATRSARRRRS